MKLLEILGLCLFGLFGLKELYFVK